MNKQKKITEASTAAQRAAVKAEAFAALKPPGQLLQERQRAEIHATLENAPGATWFCAEIYGGKEYAIGARIAARNEKGGRFAVYFPERTVYKGKPRGRAGKRRRYFENVARGYMFIGVQAPADIYTAARIRGVGGILGREGRPAIMAAPDINRMAKAAGDPGLTKHIEPAAHVPFMPGDTARVIGGPMHGQTITIKAIRPGFARFVADMFGSKIKADIRLDNLERGP